MYLYVLRWDIITGRSEDYETWTKFAIERTLAVPGVKEFRAFRPAAGSSQVVVTYEFTSFEDWTSWFNNPDIQQIFDKLFELTTNVDRELWEPSPLAPAPIRPQQGH